MGTGVHMEEFLIGKRMTLLVVFGLNYFLIRRGLHCNKKSRRQCFDHHIFFRPRLHIFRRRRASLSFRVPGSGLTSDANGMIRFRSLKKRVDGIFASKLHVTVCFLVKTKFLSASICYFGIDKKKKKLHISRGVKLSDFTVRSRFGLRKKRFITVLLSLSRPPPPPKEKEKRKEMN